MKGATYWKSVLQNQKTTQNGIIDIIFRYLAKLNHTMA